MSSFAFSFIIEFGLKFVEGNSPNIPGPKFAFGGLAR